MCEFVRVSVRACARADKAAVARRIAGAVGGEASVLLLEGANHALSEVLPLSLPSL